MPKYISVITAQKQGPGSQQRGTKQTPLGNYIPSQQADIDPFTKKKNWIKVYKELHITFLQIFKIGTFLKKKKRNYFFFNPTTVKIQLYYCCAPKFITGWLSERFCIEIDCPESIDE